MSSLCRRDFLKQGSMAAALASTAPGFASQQVNPTGDGADLIVYNGVIYTVDDSKPRAQAFAVQNGRFQAVGSNPEIRKLAGQGTKAIDAQGMTIVPGLIDAHCHPASSGLDQLVHVDCNLRSIAEIKKAIGARAEKTRTGGWVIGFKYDDTKLEDGRPLTRGDLDKAAPNHPVRVTHRGTHTAVFNSAAMKLAGVSRDTPDPEGGKLGRDDKGELTGFAAELATELFTRVMPKQISTARQRQAGVKLISEMMTAAGLTSVHDSTTDRDDFIAYQAALAAGEMKFRVYAIVLPDLFQSLQKAGVRTGFGNDRLRIGGLKLFSDGSASERTMRMSTPYVGRPNDFGILTITQEKLNDQVAEAHSAGWQVGVHANGDVAIDMVLKAYELAQRRQPRLNCRHRIEHCTLVNPGLLKRIAEQGVIPTPFYTYVYYHGDKWAQYGEEKVRWMFAHRSFLDHGIKVAAGSDYVPGPYEPLMAIQSMVTRRDYKGRPWGENQKITVPEALKICTMHGAWASFEESQKGSITPGKLADFVILASDPHKADPNVIKDIQVMRTVVGGTTVYEKS